MADFVFRANIQHYQDQLSRETDPAQIATLRRLLAEEEAKLRDFEAKRKRAGAAE